MALVPSTSVGGSASDLQSGKVQLSSGSVTTVSATFADVTGLTVTLTTGARRCLVVVTGTASQTLLGTASRWDIAVDGTRQGGTNGLFAFDGTGVNFNYSVSFCYLTDVLTAAAHTIKLQFATGAATLSAVATAAQPFTFAVTELYSV